MTTPEQQQIRDSYASGAETLLLMMQDTATVVRPTLAPDAYGGQAATDVTVVTLPCRRKSLSGRELARVAEVAPNATTRVVVPAGSDVRATDALLIDGVRFEVLWVPSNTFSVQLACLCAEVS